MHGKRRITAGTALRLTRYFATTDRFWPNLQTRYDLEIEKDNLGGVLEQIQPLQSALSRTSQERRNHWGLPAEMIHRGRTTRYLDDLARTV